MKSARPGAPRALAAAALALALAGCATTGATNPRDPWEGVNRHTHNFNEGLDRVVLKPVATLYREKVPPLVRTGGANFFGNMSDAWSAVNSLLQFRLQDAGENLARVQLNTMFGVFGIFDVASDLNIERHREDFGQTLGRWGVPAGPYLVLPLLGPSTVRDALVLPIEWRGDLVRQIDPTNVRHLVMATRIVNQRSNLLRLGTVVEEAALDRYTFTRDAYLQRRRAEVDDVREDKGDGAVPPTPVESRPAPAAAPGAPAARPPAAAPR